MSRYNFQGGRDNRGIARIHGERREARMRGKLSSIGPEQSTVAPADIVKTCNFRIISLSFVRVLPSKLNPLLAKMASVCREGLCQWELLN